MIRKAQVGDIDGLSKLFELFIKESMGKYNFIFEVNKATETLSTIIKDHLCLVMDEGELVGGFGGLKTSSFMHPDTIMQEIFFYIKPEYRSKTVQFLNKIEDESTALNIKTIVVGHPEDNERFGKLLELKGYKPLERHYIKRL